LWLAVKGVGDRGPDTGICHTSFSDLTFGCGEQSEDEEGSEAELYTACRDLADGRNLEDGVGKLVSVKNK
jgi:hypothetical protein